jgi:hypothetical protein
LGRCQEQPDTLSAGVPEPAKTTVSALKTPLQDLLDQVGAALKKGSPGGEAPNALATGLR